jgi:hypothetical protein
MTERSIVPDHAEIHPDAQAILDQIRSAEYDVLRKPSPTDETFKQLLQELNHSEEIQRAILRWLPGLTDAVTALGRRLAALELEVDQQHDGASEPTPLSASGSTTLVEADVPGNGRVRGR